MHVHRELHCELRKLIVTGAENDDHAAELFAELQRLWRMASSNCRTASLLRFQDALASRLKNWLVELNHEQREFVEEVVLWKESSRAKPRPCVLLELYLTLQTDGYFRKRLCMKIEDKLLRANVEIRTVELLRRIYARRGVLMLPSLIDEVVALFEQRGQRKKPSRIMQALVVAIFHRIAAMTSSQLAAIKPFDERIAQLELLYTRCFGRLPLRSQYELAKARVKIISKAGPQLGTSESFLFGTFAEFPTSAAFYAVLKASGLPPPILCQSVPSAKVLHRLCRSLFEFCSRFPHFRYHVDTYASLLASWLMRRASDMTVEQLIQCDASLARFTSITHSPSYHRVVRAPVVALVKQCSVAKLNTVISTYGKSHVSPTYLGKLANQRICRGMSKVSAPLLGATVAELAEVCLCEHDTVVRAYKKMISLPCDEQEVATLVRLAETLGHFDDRERLEQCLMLATYCLDGDKPISDSSARRWHRLSFRYGIALPERASRARFESKPKSSLVVKQIAKVLRDRFGYSTELEAFWYGYFVDIGVQLGNSRVAIECDHPLFHRLVLTDGEQRPVVSDVSKEATLAINNVPCFRVRLKESFHSPDAIAEQLHESISSYGLTCRSVG